MTKRIVPYGYAIEDGCYTLEAEEAAVVQQIYSLYLTGESYARIADSLNHSGPAYHPEHPLWNKHIIKRILENSKYTGQQDYPPIIAPVQFKAVQELIASKSASQSRKEKAEDEPLWKYLSCTCGRKLCRTGGGPKDRSLVNLRCSQCETTIQISRTALTSAALNAYNAYHRVESKSYTPSSEVIRLNNAINRSLEQPDQLKDIIQQIFDGIGARFQCCSAPSNHPDLQSLGEINWRHFSDIIKTITVCPDGTITPIFKEQEGPQHG